MEYNYPIDLLYTFDRFVAVYTFEITVELKKVRTSLEKNDLSIQKMLTSIDGNWLKNHRNVTFLGRWQTKHRSLASALIWTLSASL